MFSALSNSSNTASIWFRLDRVCCTVSCSPVFSLSAFVRRSLSLAQFLRSTVSVNCGLPEEDAWAVGGTEEAGLLGQSPLVEVSPSKILFVVPLCSVSREDDKVDKPVFCTPKRGTSRVCAAVNGIFGMPLLNSDQSMPWENTVSLWIWYICQCDFFK